MINKTPISSVLTKMSGVRKRGGVPSELYLQFEPFVFRLQVFSFLKLLIYRGFSLFYIDFFKCYTNVKTA